MAGSGVELYGAGTADAEFSEVLSQGYGGDLAPVFSAQGSKCAGSKLAAGIDVDLNGADLPAGLEGHGRPRVRSDDLDETCSQASKVTAGSKKTDGTMRSELWGVLRGQNPAGPGSPQELAAYEKVKEMGAGGFGVVHEVESPSKRGMKLAMKTIDLITLKNRERFAHEVRIAQQMDHPFIVRVHQCFESNEAYNIVMDLCSEYDLLLATRKAMKLDFFSQPQQKGLPGPVTGPYAEQMLSAIAYMHHHNIAHRDVKPENWMLASEPKSFQDDSYSSWPELKLIDFGFARPFKKNERMRSQVGTVRYVAPEVMGNIEGYTEACDTYGLGATFYTVFSGTFAYNAEDDDMMLALIKVRDAQFGSPDWQRHPKSLRKLIAEMMDRNPAQRPTPKVILRTNDWLAKNKDGMGGGGPPCCCTIA